MRTTEGGAFDRDDRPIYFAAGNGVRDVNYPPYVLVATNDCFTSGGEQRLLGFLDSGRKVLLDSGIYWLVNQHAREHGISMHRALSLVPEEVDGFADLFERYVDLATRYGPRLWGYIELDLGGQAHKTRIREILHDKGLEPMPVYHPFNDPWEYFDELAQGYDRICLGNMAQSKPSVRLRLLHTLWERCRAYPDLWVHVLGLTIDQRAIPFHVDSCDSSTWLSPLRWNTVMPECAYLHRLVLGRDFRYDQRADSDEANGLEAAGILCKESIMQTNAIWRNIDSVVAGLGDLPRPARAPGEGAAIPFSTRKGTS